MECLIPRNDEEWLGYTAIFLFVLERRLSIFSFLLALICLNSSIFPPICVFRFDKLLKDHRKCFSFTNRFYQGLTISIVNFKNV